MDSIYKILESLDQVRENTQVDPNQVEKLLKRFDGNALEYNAYGNPDTKAVVNALQQGDINAAMDEIDYLGPDGDEPRSGFDNLLQDLKDDFMVIAGINEGSINEGQYDGKSREELLKMKAEAEASIKNMKSSGTDPQSKFYDETQMMMAQQHLKFINDALKKVGESVEEAEITPIDHSDDEEGGASVEDIESAITRRMMNHPKFGELIREIDIIDLNDAIEDVARFHEGGDLGSSDVSAMVNDVLKQLKKEGALSEQEVNEEEVEEGNEFTEKRLAAIKAGKDSFEVGGKTYKVTGDTSDEEKMTEDYDKDEYDEEGEMADNQLDVVADAAKELQDIIDSDDNLPEWVQSKITKAMDYLDTARDYMKSVEDDMEQEPEELEERKLSSSEEKEMERIVTAMKDDPETVKDMKERYGKRWEEVAYATATKMAKQHGKGTGNKKKKKTESTVAGAVAVSADATGSNVYGNPSVYESMNTQVENMITESMSVNVSSSTEGEPSVTVTATGEDANMLAQLLQLAAVPKQPCEVCGQVHEGDCMREDNEANSAENTHTYDMQYLLNAISGGLNGQKRQINPNNPGDNPLAMQGIGKNSLNLEESDKDTSVSHLEALYKEFKAK